MQGETRPLLPGDGLICLYLKFATVPIIEWFRDGQQLTALPGQIVIEPSHSSERLDFLTDNALVPGNYTCKANASGIVREASFTVRKAGEEQFTGQDPAAVLQLPILLYKFCLLQTEYSLSIEGNAHLIQGEDLKLSCNFSSEENSLSPDGKQWMGPDNTIVS